jgi:class 3 adenylate cyclase/tetratricopeptide (TPR) repeat protein
MSRCANCGHVVTEAFKFCPECGEAVAPAAREERKTVTILFCDIVGSTELGERHDPESVRRVLSRYFDTVRTVVERHGGTVEKFIGDAVMAVFGVPTLHEDDALRAVRAAAELRDETRDLNAELGREFGTQLAVRIGINTGQVVTGTDERLATGDVVNVAARLEQNAAAGQILLGDDTRALVRDAVGAEPVPPLRLKGKSDPVQAWRLDTVRDEEGRRLSAVRMVGRAAELDRLEEVFRDAVETQSCRLVTVVGAAGVGKSRLVAEFLGRLDGAWVLLGRCPSYGEGITYWPVVEVVRQLQARIEQLVPDRRVLEALRGLLGADRTVSSTEEIAWAVRRLLEAAAAERPVICVLDDVNWGEETFLDLVDQVGALTRDVPLVVVCLARPDLLDRRPGWGGGGPNTTTLLLEPLSDEEADSLIEELLGGVRVDPGLRARIRGAAEGNPLFVEEMIAVLRDAPGREISVPPTIQALLTVRLDQLDSAERELLQCGAVEGRVFHRGAVQALTPEETEIGARLAALVHKDLIRPEPPQLADEDAYRFRHSLIRDAAYETLAKEARAELHERFADWLGHRVSELTEPEDILGYHLEQAHRYRVELRPIDQYTRELGERAGTFLAAAGARALGRDDVVAALKLLRRALALSPADDPAVGLRLDLSQALFLSGDFPAAADVANDAVRHAAAAGDEAGEMRARLVAARIAAQMHRGAEADGEPSAELLSLAEQARPVFAHAGDEVGLTDAWVTTAWAELIRCRWAPMLEAVEHALEHARVAGHARWERELPIWKGTALFYGPMPVDEVLRWYEQEEPQHTMALNERAVLEAMRERFDEARTLLAAAEAATLERGEKLWRAGGGMSAWEVEMLAGDAAAAERAARRACELLEELGDVAFRASAAGQLAASLYALERLAEAEHWAQVAEELASGDDTMSNMLWRQVRAKLLARGGRHSDGERLAIEAVARGGQTDMLNWHAGALADLAEVYALAARTEDARTRLEQALGLYERKGNLVSAARTRAAMDCL